MRQGKFVGNSSIGNIQDALTDAFEKAKQELKADLITWKLEEISGKNGGFVRVNEINVVIIAEGPPEGG
jgi:hypothetical protein